MSNTSNTEAFKDGMKQEYNRVADGLHEGPSSDHQRQGENTQGLLNRYGPGGSAFSTTDNVSDGTSNLVDALKSSTGLGQSNTEQAKQGASNFAQGAKDELNAISSGPNSGAAPATGGGILDSIKHAVGYEQTPAEQAQQAGTDFKRGAENFGQGAKDEFKTVADGLRDGPSTGSAPSSGGSVLDSIKHATGYEQTATEQAKDAGSDFKRGAENFGQGAKDEFKTVSDGLRDGPSTGTAPSSGGVWDSIKHATGYEQTATEQAKEAGSDFKRGAENFGQGAKDEFKTVSDGLRDGPSTGTAPSSGGGILDSIKNATGFGQTYTDQAAQGAHDLKEGAKSEYNAMSSSSGEGVLDSLKSATGLGEPTYTGQAKQGAHDLKEGAKSEYNSLTSGSSTGSSGSVLDNIKHATGLDQVNSHSLTDNSSTPSDQYRGMTTTSGPTVPLGHNTEDVTPAELQATDSERLV